MIRVFILIISLLLFVACSDKDTKENEAEKVAHALDDR